MAENEAPQPAGAPAFRQDRVIVTQASDPGGNTQVRVEATIKNPAMIVQILSAAITVMAQKMATNQQAQDMSSPEAKPKKPHLWIPDGGITGGKN